MDALDRLLACTGARALVTRDRRMKWLLLEVIPPLVWNRIAGGMSIDSVYLVSFLLLLGAADRDLGLLPLAFNLGVLVNAGLVALRHRAGGGRDPRGFAIRFALYGRLAWAGVLLWPLAAWWLHLPAAAVVYGTLGCLAVAQVLLLSSASAWVSWTAEVVPQPLRGQFFAWRFISSQVGCMTALLVAKHFWPADPDGRGGPLWYLMVIFAASWLGCLASTVLLARGPLMPGTAAGGDPATATSTTADGDRPAFWRFVGWNAAIAAALTMSMVYTKPWIRGLGLTDRDYAWYDGWVRTPALVAAVLASVWMLRRWRTRPLVLVMTLLTAAATALLLAAGFGWRDPLLAAAFAFDSAAKGMSGVVVIGYLLEVSPGRDPRYPAIYFACGGAGAMLAGGVQLVGARLLPEALAPGALLGLGLLLALIAVPLLRPTPVRAPVPGLPTPPPPAG